LHSRFFVTPGFRLDNSTTSGANAGLTALPKVDFSWLAIDRQGETPMFGVLTMFRPRLALGVAGVQPGPADHLRLVGSTSSGSVLVKTLGNSELRPERSSEIEGGFEADLWASRLSVDVTGYRKMRHDAIVNVPVPGSVNGGGSINKNIGLIRNAGAEFSANARVVEASNIGWDVQVKMSSNTNRVVRLNPGQKPIELFNGLGVVSRVKAGYPLFGWWAYPVRGYRDANHDGILQVGEVLVGDSLVFLGQQDPRYQLGFGTDVSLFRRFSVHAFVDYTNGLTQYNASGQGISAALFDPRTPLAEQAGAVARYFALGTHSGTAFSEVQTVSTLRFQTLSVNYELPLSIARRFRASAMGVALQGSNLGLHTNYKGKDPNVNAFATGNQTLDTGVLPQPRTWSLQVRIGN